MKKYILTIVVALGLTASISAQDSYYYCSGDKVLLTEHSTKVVAMAPKGNSFSLPLSNGLILTDTISDSNSLITVYELSSTVTPSRVKALVPTSTSVNLQSCYNTEDGTELIPDGYINVNLKRHPITQNCKRLLRNTIAKLLSKMNLCRFGIASVFRIHPA